MLAIITSRKGPTRKTTVCTAAILAVTAVGASRLYLGAHWLTDVIGGWALGALWLTVILAAVRLVPARPATSDRTAPAAEGTGPPSKPAG